MKQLLLLFLTPIVIYAAYVGDQSCKSCHHKEHHEWKGSHHDLAMQPATAKTVLGSFNNTTFNYNAITSTFYKRGKSFMVHTDGADGKLNDFEITYTFGVYPLQQYMIPFEGGRLQVLDIAWDSRSKSEGGQRWFHLHPDDNVSAGDVLHWTGMNLNWNYMCADCHSTNLKKNYDPETKSYTTTYEQINVSCESCHGEGSEHLLWAKNPDAYTGTLKQGLAIDLSHFGKERWTIDPKSGRPELIGEIDRSEVQLCAKCHSRRAQIDDDFAPGKRFEDHYLASVLEERLYFSDGKMKDEVYVYGSFKQSKMYKAGVTCSNCHNSHTLERRAVGDQVCNKCHRRVTYDTPQHHHHKSDSAGCIDCHMPSRTYMGVDERNSHGFRVPRPDLSEKIDTPNACNSCHTDKNSAWSVDAMQKWYGEIPKGYQQFSHALHTLHNVDKEALDALYEALMRDTPSIAKASAVGFLGNYPSRQTYVTTLQMLRHTAPEIRTQAIRAIEGFPAQVRTEALLNMLDDDVKTVRIEAARILSDLPQDNLPSEKKALLKKVLAEYKASLLFNAERPESQIGLAQFYINSGKSKKVEAAFQEAIRLQKWYAPAYINFADFLRQNGDEKRAFTVLQDGLKVNNESADLHYATGLWFVRNKNSEMGLLSLQKAAALDPQNANYAYVYAVALASVDQKRAIAVLEKNVTEHSGHVESLFALAYYYKLAGDQSRAKYYQQEAERIGRFVPNIQR